MSFFSKLFGPPTKDKFADMMIKAIRKAGEEAKLIYDPQAFSITAERDNKNVFNLGNVYAEYCGAPKDIQQIAFQNAVRTWFAYLKEVPDDFEDAKHDLLPVVRSCAYYGITNLQMRLQGMNEIEWKFRPLTEHLGVNLVYDLPESTMQISADQFAKWNVGFDDAYEIACRNLETMSQEEFVGVAPGVWASPWNDSYGAARLVLPELLRRLDVEGDPVLAVPNRDVVLVTGSEDDAGLEAMMAIAEKALEHPRSISGIPVRLTDDGLLPFLPPVDHPCHRRIKLVWLKTLASEYGEQKHLLDAMHEKTGEDIFVASFSVAQKDGTGAFVNYCVWVEGVSDGLLPKTEKICFSRADEGQGVRVVPWDDACRVVANLMTPMGMHPERYRVQEFPSDGQLDSMGEHEMF